MLKYIKVFVLLKNVFVKRKLRKEILLEEERGLISMN